MTNVAAMTAAATNAATTNAAATNAATTNLIRRMMEAPLTAEKTTVLHHPATPLTTTQLKTDPPTDRAPLTAAKPPAGFLLS